MIINADNLILGRFASFVAKRALLGEEITIVNCERAVVTGNKKQVILRYKSENERGGKTIMKGPYQQKVPDRFVKRVIKRMLPHKKPRGREALKRIKCYIGVPEEFSEKKMETLESANIKKVKNPGYVRVGEICSSIGKWKK